MKLKTLKDREKQWMKSRIDQSKKDILLQFNFELKQEAIKWVKSLEQNKPIEANSKNLTKMFMSVGKIEFIKHFFNITESDLKELEGGKD